MEQLEEVGAAARLQSPSSTPTNIHLLNTIARAMFPKVGSKVGVKTSASRNLKEDTIGVSRDMSHTSPGL
ncbi:hypothetical protein ACKVWC_001862 [Pyricularia oryzae]